MRHLRIPLLALALVGLIAVAGCGSSDSTDSSDSISSEELSSDAYAEQAQAILISFGTSFQQLGSDISSSQSPGEFSDLVNQAELEIQGAIDDFGALQPPAEAQEGNDQVLSALENFSSKLTDVSEAADAGNKQALAEAATALQSAGLDFESELTQAQQSLEDAGITLGADSTTTTPTTGG